MARRFAQVTVAAAALGAGVLCAAPAQASGWYVQGVPGASCQVDKRTTASFEYRGRRLVNMSTHPFEIVVAVCPVTLFAPGVEAREYRIDLKDPERRDTWCHAYRGSGSLFSTQWADWGDYVPFSGSLGAPLPGAGGLVELTFHCLLQSGASLDRIDIVWYEP
jgi:hypothetical protein